MQSLRKEGVTMRHLLMVLIILFVNAYLKTWRKLPGNTGSLIYVVTVNILYYIICQKKHVWEFTSNTIPINKLRLLHTFITTPALTLLCLSGINDLSKGKKVLHLLTCSCVSTIMEWFANKKWNMIEFYNGWNIKWSGIIYTMLYFFSYYFKKNPILTLILSVLTMNQFVQWFKIPINKEMFTPANLLKVIQTTFTVEK